MGYQLEAILGKSEALSQHVFEFQSARLVSLAQGIAMIPLTDALAEEIDGDSEVETFYKFAPGIEERARRISQHSPVA